MRLFADQPRRALWARERRDGALEPKRGEPFGVTRAWAESGTPQKSGRGRLVERARVYGCGRRSEKVQGVLANVLSRGVRHAVLDLRRRSIMPVTTLDVGLTS